MVNLLRPISYRFSAHSQKWGFRIFYNFITAMVSKGCGKSSRQNVLWKAYLLHHRYWVVALNNCRHTLSTIGVFIADRILLNNVHNRCLAVVRVTKFGKSQFLSVFAIFHGHNSTSQVAQFGDRFRLVGNFRSDISVEVSVFHSRNLNFRWK